MIITKNLTVGEALATEDFTVEVNVSRMDRKKAGDFHTYVKQKRTCTPGNFTLNCIREERIEQLLALKIFNYTGRNVDGDRVFEAEIDKQWEECRATALARNNIIRIVIDCNENDTFDAYNYWFLN